MDADGYPDEMELKKIAEWSVSDGFNRLMEYVKGIWRYSDIGYWKRDRYGDSNEYHISTGGWSGNESIVIAMRENFLFWLLCWYQSTKGGHYIFRIPEYLDDKQDVVETVKKGESGETI